MRLSVRKTDPGYSREAVHYQLYLDGTKVENCHTADEEMGYAVGYLHDAQGRLEVLHPGMDIIREYIVQGKVEVRRVSFSM